MAIRQGEAGYSREWVYSNQDTGDGSSVSPSGSHAPNYHWFALHTPAAYSSQGQGGAWDLHLQNGGGHNGGQIVWEGKVLCPVHSQGSADSGRIQGTAVWRTFYGDGGTGYSTYGTELTPSFYYWTSAANNTGIVFLKIKASAREPFILVIAKFTGHQGGGYHANFEHLESNDGGAEPTVGVDYSGELSSAISITNWAG